MQIEATNFTAILTIEMIFVNVLETENKLNKHPFRCNSGYRHRDSLELSHNKYLLLRYIDDYFNKSSVYNSKCI